MASEMTSASTSSGRGTDQLDTHLRELVALARLGLSWRNTLPE